MTFDEFDQTLDQGWRALAKQGDYVGAAHALDAYREAHPHLKDWQIRTLHFHAAQMYAFAGDVEIALAHLPFTRIADEPADAPVRWNDYVTATEAFLHGDLPVLLAARERIAQGQVMDGRVPNLPVVDRLIAHFGKPYSEAY